MRVDFYQLTRDPAERVVPQLAEATLRAGERLLVVAEAPDLLARIGRGLWQNTAESFLAHGAAGAAHDARQPILLGTTTEAANGARYCILADGLWREAGDMARIFLLFPPDRIDDARGTWRVLGKRDGVERRYWRQDGGKWVEGP